MRNSTDLCQLCNERPSNKRNSHLIPKFFGKGIFDGANPRIGIQILENGNSSKVQDTIKEDYILCADCEKGFAIYETYCALRLDRFDNVRFKEKFKRFRKGEFQYFECFDLNIKIYNLLIYSIVWRLSISQHYAFERFKLTNEDEEQLRSILFRYTSNTQSELIDKLNSLKELPCHSHVMIRPINKIRPAKSMLSAASIDDSIHQLHLVDYLVFYVTNRHKLVTLFKEIDNNTIERNVKVGLTEPSLWSEFYCVLMNKMWK